MFGPWNEATGPLKLAPSVVETVGCEVVGVAPVWMYTGVFCVVEAVDGVLEELGLLVREIPATPDEPPVRHPAELAPTDQEHSLLGHLDNHPVGVDELILRTSLTASRVMATLCVLELRRLVRRLPVHQFIRV